jgi:hypothetical protein
MKQKDKFHDVVAVADELFASALLQYLRASLETFRLVYVK